MSEKNEEHVNKRRNYDFNITNDSLLGELKIREEKLKVAIRNKQPQEEIFNLTEKVEHLRKSINKRISTLHLDYIIPPGPNIQELRYREAYDYSTFSKINELSFPDISSLDETVVKHKENIILRQPILTLNSNGKGAIPKQLTSAETDSCVGCSTPLTGKRNIYRENLEKLLQQENDFIPINTTIHTIKKELSIQVKQEILDSFFEDKENLKELQASVRRGLGIINIVNFFKEKLNIFNNTQKTLKNTLEITLSEINSPDPQSYKSAISFIEQENIIEEEMNNAYNRVRGLSLKDALDLIPRYNGQNIPLVQFLEGCQEAKSILPAELEGELAKLIRIRLYGDALNSIRGQTLENITEACEFFEKIFGTSKTYHDCTGELAKLKQKGNENVIIFYNRLSEIKNEILKSAQRENRVGNIQNFLAQLEADCLKFFLKGLRWEIRARLGNPATLKLARDEALEIEREYACSILEESDGSRNKEDHKLKFNKEARKINFIETIICSYCGKAGHGAINCLSLARSGINGQNRNNNNYDGNNNNNFARNNRNENARFGGWNAENRRGTEFLPPRNNYNLNNQNGLRNNNYKPYENPRFGNNSQDIRNNSRAMSYNNHRFNNDNNNYRNNNFYNNNNNQPRMTNTQIPTCFYCGRLGHWQKDCFKLQRETRNDNRRQQGNPEPLSSSGAEREIAVAERPTTPAEQRGATRALKP